MAQEKDLFKRSEFLRNVMTLMPGTLLSQAIPILFSVILARIYSPALFGIYFMFTAILGLAIIFATGKYELAILLPENIREASRLIGVALTTCISVCVMLEVAFIAGGSWIAGYFKTPELKTWLLLLPVSLFFSSANEIFYYWHNRNKRYKLLSRSKIIQTLTSSSLQLILGLLIAGVTGLIVGLVCGQALSFIYLFVYYRVKDKTLADFSLFRDYKLLARKYINFPRDIATAALVNETANQFPNIFMTRFLGQAVVGHYGYAQRTVKTPLGVISNAFSDVYKSRAAEYMNIHGNCKAIYKSTVKNLFFISIIPFAIFYFIAPQAFAIIFGEAFRTSGVYAQVLTIPFFLNFISMPVSSTFYLLHRTKLFLGIQISGLILVILSIFLGFYISHDSLMIITLLSVSFSITNLLMLIFSYWLVYGKSGRSQVQ